MNLLCFFCGQDKEWKTRLKSGEIVCKECYEEMSIEIGAGRTTLEKELEKVRQRGNQL